MTDLLSIVERGLKAVRYGFFCVNDQIALALDGFCHAPAMDYTDLTEASDPDFEPAYGSFCYGTVPLLDLSTPPSSAAVPPAVAEGPSGGDLAPPLSPGATNPTGHPKPYSVIEQDLAEELSDAVTDSYDHGLVDAPVDTGWLSASVDWLTAARTLLMYFDVQPKK